MRSLYFLCSFLLAVLVDAASKEVHDDSFTPDIILRVTEQNTTLSCESRFSALVNGTVPGPTIRITEGEKKWIRVYNDMAEKNTTIHWHGLAEMVAPFSDGTPGASQYPIAAKHYFDYEIQTYEGSAGTYFFHSHVGLQANTAAGTLIIDDKKSPPYEYDEERIIYFSDYWNNTDSQAEAGLVANPFVWEGEVKNVLVNGKGRLIDSSVANGKGCELEGIDVEPGKTYRLRFVASTGLSFISLAIEGHDNLTLIEADGAYTQPHSVDYLQIGSGQRYSALLKAKSKEELGNKTSFYLQLETLERPTSVTAYAVLRYPDAPKAIEPPVEPPLALPNTTYGYLDYEISPYSTVAATSNDTNSGAVPHASDVSRRVTLEVRQVTYANLTPQLVWSVNNNTPWLPTFPQKPYLVALYENDTSLLPNYEDAVTHGGGFDRKTRTFPAKVGEIIDIVIQAVGLGAANGQDVHPFHFHGAHYWDLGSGNGTYDPSAHEALLQQQYARGWQPVKRDTSMLFRTPGAHADNGTGTNWRVWRLRVTDPGVWMLHCHTLAHMEMGMQSVWVMGNASQVAPLPSSLVQGYLTFGGDAYGSSDGNDTSATVLSYYDE